MAKKSGGPSYPKSDGKQSIVSRTDYGAKRMFDATVTPSWVKDAASGNFTKYKHNEK